MPGGPLRGAAFPRILPSMDPQERVARLTPERPAALKMLASSLHNALAAARLSLHGDKGKTLRQTWTRP